MKDAEIHIEVDNINSFSMQAPEKQNHVTKIHYARQTNRHTKNNKFTLLKERYLIV